jgi:uncharacterized protein YqjF (DUF2071 family)
VVGFLLVLVLAGGIISAAALGLDHWLTGRWRAYSGVAGQLVTVPVQHQPWPLWDASLVNLEQPLLTAAGLPEPEDAPLLQYSPGVDVRLGTPHPVE